MSGSSEARMMREADSASEIERGVVVVVVFSG